MDLEKILNIIKLPVGKLLVVFLAICIVSGFLLFSPTDLQQYLGVDELLNQYRGWISISFLLSSSLVILIIITAVYKWVHSKYTKFTLARQLKLSQEEMLKALNLDEKRVIFTYIMKNTHTQYFSLENGVIAGLESKGIVYRATNIGHIDRWAYNMEPWAWTFFQNHSMEIFASIVSDPNTISYVSREMGVSQEEARAWIIALLQQLVNLSKTQTD